jgi:hypothetical protein
MFLQRGNVGESSDFADGNHLEFQQAGGDEDVAGEGLSESRGFAPYHQVWNVATWSPPKQAQALLKTFKYRLYPTFAQERQMFQVLNVCRHWYNMCLAEHKWSYELEGVSISKAQQERAGVQYRKTFPQAQIVFSQTMQSVCDNLDKAFRAFFRRVKAGEKPGYPRFKGRNHFHSFAFKQFGVGIRLDGWRLRLYGIGRVAVRWHRPIEGEIKMVRIILKAGKWYAAFACEVPDLDHLAETGAMVGIDVGISALLPFSNGVKVENPNDYRMAQKKLRCFSANSLVPSAAVRTAAKHFGRGSASKNTSLTSVRAICINGVPNWCETTIRLRWKRCVSPTWSAITT